MLLLESVTGVYTQIKPTGDLSYQLLIINLLHKAGLTSHVAGVELVWLSHDPLPTTALHHPGKESLVPY